MFRYSTELKLRDTDAAGVAFFAAYYSIAHDAYETFLNLNEAALHTWLDQVHLPIVHSEADYTAPLKLGTRFDVQLSCTRLGDRSFSLQYDFLIESVSLAQVKTVHVAVNHNQADDSVKSVLLPPKLKSLLSTQLVISRDTATEPQVHRE